MSWAAAIGATTAAIGIAAGLIQSSNQKKKAQRELDRLNKSKVPETIPEEVIKNQELAKIRASTGLPSEQYNLAMKNINRQQQRSLRGASDRKMGLGLVSTLNDNANTAIGNLDSQNAIARLKNEKVLMDVNNQVANWKKGIFDRDVRQVWERNYDYNMGLLGQANQNKANAINSGISLLGSAASSFGSKIPSSRNRSNANWAASYNSVDDGLSRGGA